MSDDKQQAQTSLMAQLEQEYMLAQVISGMPSNVEGGPDITTPAPIRAKWAHRLYQQGVRVHPDLATHKVVAHPSGVAGNHGPRSFQKIDSDRLMSIIQQQNPTLYARLQSVQKGKGGEGSVEKMLQMIAERLPQEWLDKLAPKVEAFADDHIPDDSPYGKP